MKKDESLWEIIWNSREFKLTSKPIVVEHDTANLSDDEAEEWRKDLNEDMLGNIDATRDSHKINFEQS
jgi:hypothetical protein